MVVKPARTFFHPSSRRVSMLFFHGASPDLRTVCPLHHQGLNGRRRHQQFKKADLAAVTDIVAPFATGAVIKDGRC